MIYGLIRPHWRLTSEHESLIATLSSLEREDTIARRNAVAEKMIVDAMMPPRTVWDLYSNRVLPLWAIESNPDISANSFQRIMPLAAVSHAWSFPEDRDNVLTMINSKKWPVPIPKHTRLADIRIELLNMEAEYVWLDVLCLRQADGEAPEEGLREEEWKLDVPTIGAVYSKCREVIVYLDGLGRPFKENDLESTRHWCNRAWTVQKLF